MGTPLIYLIVLLSGIICALAGFWFYRAAQERRQHGRLVPLAPQAEYRPVRNEAWDRAVRASRNRNW
jgi:hypothetical protein